MSNFIYRPKIRQRSHGGLLAYAPKEKRRWCKRHPESFWGKKKDGTYFDRCMKGHYQNQDCVIGETEVDNQE